MSGSCPNPMRTWVSLTARAEVAVSHRIAAVAKRCAIHPRKAILLCVLVCLICGAGLALIEIENEGRELWADQNSAPMKNLEYVEDNFEQSPRRSRMLVTARDGGNILEMSKFAEVFTVAEDVRALKGNGLAYSDLCTRVASGDCLGVGAIRYFNSSLAVFNAQVTSQSDLLEKINSATYPDDGSRTFPASVMGGITRDASGSITGATAVRLDWILDGGGDYDDMLAWEKELQDSLVDEADGLIQQRYSGVDVFLMAERSRDDELARTVGGDVPLFALAFVLMSSFCALLLGKPCSCTQGRRLLGMMDFYLVLLGCIAGYGIATLIGIPFTVLQQILPFILVGIGIDDAFVITSAFDATDESLPVEDRIEKAMQRVGVSITLTSLTDIAAFLLGSMSVFPSVKYFCIYASISCFFVWALHCTAYCAMLAMDSRRAQASPPALDPCACCNPCSNFCLPPEGATQGPTKGTKTPLAIFLGRVTRVLVSHPIIMLLTMLGFAAVAGLSMWTVSQDLGTEFKLIDLTPDTSFLRDFYNEEKLHFGGISFGLGVPCSYYIRDVDFSSVETQLRIEEVGAAMIALQTVNNDAGLTSWHTAFSLWAWEERGNLAVLPEDAFETVPGGASRAGCEVGLPPGVVECSTHFLTGETFGDAVAHFLSLPQYGRYEDDVIFHGAGRSGGVRAARVRAQHIDTFNSDEQVDVLESAEDFTDRWQGALPGSFMLGSPYIFYDQFRIIVGQMLTSILLCLLAVTVISAFVLAHPLSVLIVLCVLALVFMDLMGNIMLWGLDLNSISMINLVMAVGLVVDYSMHIAHSFGLQDPKLTRAERAVLAMEEIGPAVFLGVSATFVAILPLALSSSQIFRVFFQMFFGIVIVGGSHGLVLMPVCLALCGPSTAELHKSAQREIEGGGASAAPAVKQEESNDVEEAASKAEAAEAGQATAA